MNWTILFGLTCKTISSKRVKNASAFFVTSLEFTNLKKITPIGQYKKIYQCFLLSTCPPISHNRATVFIPRWKRVNNASSFFVIALAKWLQKHYRLGHDKKNYQSPLLSIWPPISHNRASVFTPRWFIMFHETIYFFYNFS